MSKWITMMTIEDVDHIDDEERKEIESRYEDWEAEARIRGIPSLGSGRVFPVSEKDIICDPVEIPNYWAQIIGVDFGWDHPFAAVSCAWDKDADVWYVTKCYRERTATPVIHSASVRPWGDWIPCAWPHDGLQHDKGSGEALADQYRDQGLNMLMEKATFEDGGNGVEAGIMEMLDRMRTGRFKVFRGLLEWMEEFRLYHRKDGQIVKVADDLMSATRYAIMMKRYALQGGAGFNRVIEYPNLGVV